MRTRSTILGFTTLIVLLSAGAAQSLSGSNTVFTDDIVDGTISTPDLKTGAVSGSKILDNSVTGTDINESTLQVRRHFVARIKVPLNDTAPTVVDGNATSVSSDTVGTYRVTFPFAVGPCTATANVAHFPGASNQFTNGAWSVTDVDDPNPNVVKVSISAPANPGSNAIASSFVLDLSCPGP